MATKSSSSGDLVGYLVLVLVLYLAAQCSGGITSRYVRKLGESVDMPLDSDVFEVPSGYNAPQQVHITQGDHEGKGIIISWVTPNEPGSSTVLYWIENSTVKQEAEGIVTQYTYYNYTSGYIHHCTITNLEYDMKYYYTVGKGKSAKTFWFWTPPEIGPDVPYTFGLIGDLGQTYDSNKTLDHYEKNPSKGQAVLYVGDLSYADKYPNSDNNRWDTWGRFTERSTAYQPWFWSAGNHDIDYLPKLERVSNINYNVTNGFCTPSKNLSAPAYVTIGDGGNVEGLDTKMKPQPSYSAFREPSYGHGILDIKNRTHVYFSWHRNDDENAVEADQTWFLNRYWCGSVDDSFGSCTNGVKSS